jgi:hypothetical protein
MTAALFGIIGALLMASVVLRLVLRRRLLVKYASLWLVISVVLVVMAVIPGSLRGLSHLLGFQVPSNLLFFCGFVLLLFVTVQVSVELTGVERRVQRLAEELALLQERTAPDEAAEADRLS